MISTAYAGDDLSASDDLLPEKGREMAKTVGNVGFDDVGGHRAVSAQEGKDSGELRTGARRRVSGPPTGVLPASESAHVTDAGVDNPASARVSSGRGLVRVGTERRAILRVGGAAAAAFGGMAAGLAADSHRGATVPLPTVSTVPVNGATGVDPSKPLTVQVRGGVITSVELSGQQVGGTFSRDRRLWVSGGVLGVDTGYRLAVKAANSAGADTTVVCSFRTLAPSASLGIRSVVPARGSTVGVGQPIRVTFTGDVPRQYQADLEKACVVSTDPPVTGAWYWVSNDSDGAVVDWRPKDYWPVGTQVSIAFDLDGVRLGEYQFGTEDYPVHSFTISDRDLRLAIDKDGFRATCQENGQVIRTFPISTGITSAETFVTYTGTMAVLGKGNPVEMKGSYGPGDTYDDFVDWATQITWSGTYVHAAPWDPDIGYANDDSHGCVHCHTADAEWLYQKVITGDVVTVSGSRARPVAVADGICTFSLDWATLLAGSAYGPTRNGKPAPSPM